MQSCGSASAGRRGLRIAYAAAALDPVRHWPVVMAGLLGKVLGPIGFVGAGAKGGFPVAFGLVIVLNDLIRWVPFSLILLQTYRSFRSPKGAPA